MAGCLACKSCAAQCPVKVNVPEFRSRFLELYHSRYLRPLKDYLIGSLEYTIPYIARVPRLYNFVMGARPVRFILEHVAGMVDTPLLSMTDFDAVCRRWGVEIATPELLLTLEKEQRARSVIRPRCFYPLLRNPCAIGLDRTGLKAWLPSLHCPFRAQWQTTSGARFHKSV